MLPVPPIITTIIDRTKTFVPMLLEAESTGTMRPPAMPQSPLPTPMVSKNILFALMPWRPATSLFSAAVNIAVPVLVFMKK